MSYHVCPKCGKHGDIEFSGSGERHAFVAVCDKDDCPQTLGIKRFAKLFKRTTDNAAGQGETGVRVSQPVPLASPAPAAPDTPWTDRRDRNELHQVGADFARSLEMLCHQQQGAVQDEIDRFHRNCCIDKCVHKDAGDCLPRQALAAYAALKKEIERG